MQTGTDDEDELGLIHRDFGTSHLVCPRRALLLISWRKGDDYPLRAEPDN
jgi:hypothetical protein